MAFSGRRCQPSAPASRRAGRDTRRSHRHDQLRSHTRRPAATHSIPVVFLGISDPVGTGLVQSLARPGGNVTGTTQSVGRNLLSKKLSLLTELAPGLTRVGFVQNFGGPAQ